MDNKEIMVQNLGLELTKRCNLNCAHCLKGESQKVDMDKDTIDAIFKQINEVNQLFFTGGEPTLAYQSLKEVIEAIKKYDVKVYKWAMDTNGTIYSPKFYMLLAELEEICMQTNRDRMIHGIVYISTDKYHLEAIEKSGVNQKDYMQNIIKTQRLPWFEGYRKLPNILINEGRAKQITERRKIEFRPMHYSLLEQENGYLLGGSGILVNVNGNITQCDCSHENQEKMYLYGNIKENNIVDIVKKSGNVVYVNTEKELYDDLRDQWDKYQARFNSGDER